MNMVSSKVCDARSHDISVPLRFSYPELPQCISPHNYLDNVRVYV